MPLVYWGLLSVIIFSEIDPSNIKRKEHGLYPVLFLLACRLMQVTDLVFCLSFCKGIFLSKQKWKK